MDAAHKKSTFTAAQCLALLPSFHKTQLGSLSEKNIRDFLGVFPKCRAPRPPIWEASVQEKIKGLFCVLGPKDHFWF